MLSPVEIITNADKPAVALPPLHRQQHALTQQADDHGLHRDLLCYRQRLDPNPREVSKSYFYSSSPLTNMLQLLYNRLVQRAPRPLLHRQLQDLLRDRARFQRPWQPRARHTPLPNRRESPLQRPPRELHLDPHANRLPGRDQPARVSSNPLPSLQRRYVVGRDEQGGQRYEFLHGGAGHIEEVSLHVHLVSVHDGCDGRVGWCWTIGSTGAVRLADWLLYRGVAVGDGGGESCTFAVGVESGVDAVYLLSSGCWEQSGRVR